MAGKPIVHIEFSSNNPEASSKFYSDLFGWKMIALPEFNYWTFDLENGTGGGFIEIGNPNTGYEVNNGYEVKPGTTITYVDSDDIEADLARAEALGATTVSAKMEIPNTGWFGVFRDPSGNLIGLYTNMPRSETADQPEAVGAAS